MNSVTEAVKPTIHSAPPSQNSMVPGAVVKTTPVSPALTAQTTTTSNKSFRTKRVFKVSLWLTVIFFSNKLIIAGNHHRRRGRRKNLLKFSILQRPISGAHRSDYRRRFSRTFASYRWRAHSSKFHRRVVG